MCGHPLDKGGPERNHTVKETQLSKTSCPLPSRLSLPGWSKLNSHRPCACHHKHCEFLYAAVLVVFYQPWPPTYLPTSFSLIPQTWMSHRGPRTAQSHILCTLKGLGFSMQIDIWGRNQMMRHTPVFGCNHRSLGVSSKLCPVSRIIVVFSHIVY